MSRDGINKFADVLSWLQSVRHELFVLAGRGKPIDKQDIRLGQMLAEMKDLVKEEFTRMTLK
jgi:hypothetical protein